MLKWHKQIVRLMLVSLLMMTVSASMPKMRFSVGVVVIDAGHGGHDPGTMGKRSKEKDIALDISLKVGRMIKEKLPDVKVIFTREKDEYIALDERAHIANKNKADLFICIHANSMPGARAWGTETYVMGTSMDNDNFEVAKRENSVILLDENYKERYEEFDPESPESYILFSLSQSAYQESSLSFAQKVEQQFRQKVGRKSRGVKQAGFLVLWRTSMPSALIETGFLSDEKEEAYLLTSAGRFSIAAGIFRAFKEYKQEVEALNE